MKKVILTFGLISGVLASLMMIATAPFFHQLQGNKGYYVGYTAMVLSFLLVYFGIRSFRDNVGHGHISFGKGFVIGLCITLISCAFYVVTWEILYFNFLHGSMTSYFDHAAAAARASAGSPEALQAKLAELQTMRDRYENPLFNAAFTVIEPLPVGLVITLISALILRKPQRSVSESGGAQVTA